MCRYVRFSSQLRKSCRFLSECLCVNCSSCSIFFFLSLCSIRKANLRDQFHLLTSMSIIIEGSTQSTNTEQCSGEILFADATERPHNHSIMTSERALITDDFPQSPSSPMKSSIPSRLTFVRHQSAPLHHRSPVKMRDRDTDPVDLTEIREQIRTYRMELYKFKANYSRSPIKRVPPSSPFKQSAPTTPVKR